MLARAYDPRPAAPAAPDHTPNASLYAKMRARLEDGERVVCVDYIGAFSREAAAVNGLDPDAVEVYRPATVDEGDRVHDLLARLGGVRLFLMY
jgi:hypothetical protein